MQTCEWFDRGAVNGQRERREILILRASPTWRSVYAQHRLYPDQRSEQNCVIISSNAGAMNGIVCRTPALTLGVSAQPKTLDIDDKTATTCWQPSARVYVLATLHMRSMKKDTPCRSRTRSLPEETNKARNVLQATAW